ncbi:MAG: MerR family transcriptional regulator [Ignavibacteriaceae bacterium]|nr:MerR family transcriptional regulator [Ignavibacteriaceae bacterium]
MRDFNIKKLYYSISEVSKITEVEQYVLRYWETEFDELKPQKNRAGNRVYTNKDIQVILTIKYLLRDKKFTIEGAKKNLRDYITANRTNEESKQSATVTQEVAGDEKVVLDDKLKTDLKKIRTFLEFLISKM